jgi:hypothetical protein
VGIYGEDRYSHVGYGAAFVTQGLSAVEEGDASGFYIGDYIYHLEEFVSI